MNDLSTIMAYASTRMFADDTNLTFTACSIPKLQHDMNVDLRYLQNWLIASMLSLNVKTGIYVGRFEAKNCFVTQGQELDLLINGISF